MNEMLTSGSLGKISLITCIVAIGCAPAATSLRHGSDLSNVRSEVVLTNGTSFTGYATYRGSYKNNELKVYHPGEKREYSYSLTEVEKLKAEEHEFVVRLLISPEGARRNGAAETTRAMVRRLGMEHDAVQVYEYKYQVKHPKSPLDKWETGWFVEFPGEPAGKPLVQLGSTAYRQKWTSLAMLHNLNQVQLDQKAPASYKELLQEIRKIPEQATEEANANIAG
ncbi:MAG TPA: hypothetical protein VK907_01635 [Phnomibacter sp.]|nr:hypothetical protein [Phnomibacter sp.]